MMTRTLYRWLICLHPRAFRLRFEEELLWIFDESSDASGAAPLLYDVVISLLRQWLMRSGMWKWVVGVSRERYRYLSDSEAFCSTGLCARNPERFVMNVCAVVIWSFLRRSPGT
jgi:hypothetical protein